VCSNVVIVVAVRDGQLLNAKSNVQCHQQRTRFIDATEVAKKAETGKI